jgi:hypothetical protein
MKGISVIHSFINPASRLNASILILSLLLANRFSTFSGSVNAGKINPYGTWAIIGSRDGLWAMHEDGSGLVQLTQDPIVQFTLSPNGAMVAYITNPDPDNLDFHSPTGFSLKLLYLYTGQVIQVASLSSPGISQKSSSQDQFTAYQALLSLKKGGMVWSPGNTYLIYTSAAQGRSADIYLYIPSSGETRRLTTFQFPNGPAFAYNIAFAATGAKIYYAVTSEFGENDENLMVGSWVSDLRGNKVQVAGSDFNGENLDTWITINDLLLSSWNPDCGKQNLRIVNAVSGQSRSVWNSCFQDMLYDRQRGQILVSVTPEMALLNPYKQDGLWIIPIWRINPRRLSDQGYDKLYHGDLTAAWFGYNQQDGLVALQTDGKSTPVSADTPEMVSASFRLRPALHKPNESVWLWTGDGLFAAAPGQPLVEIYPITPDRLWSVPTQSGLYMFSVQEGENLRFYSFRKNEWKPYLVDIKINGINSLAWNK